MMKLLYSIFTIPFIVFIFLVIPTSVFAVPSGNFVEFNGGYIKAASALPAPSLVTFEGWLKTDNSTSLVKLLSVGDSQLGKIHYELSLDGGSLGLRYSFNQTSTRLVSSGNVGEGWHLVGFSVSSSATNLMVDGNIIFSVSGAINLPPFGPDIFAGTEVLNPSYGSTNFIGEMDELLVKYGESVVLRWPFDETRGVTTAQDLSGNGIDGTLVGGDSRIHFYGIIPTPTSRILPTLRLRWILPTLSYPFPTETEATNKPTSTPTLTPVLSPTPTFGLRHPARSPRSLPAFSIENR